MQLASLLERKLKGEQRLYGMEVEVERGRTDVRVGGWSITGDGSLRDNGVEFIFDGPAPYVDSVSRVKALCALLNADERYFHHSVRTSIHIHANMMDFELAHLTRLATLYKILEPAAFAKYGEGRDSTPYCVPFVDSDEYQTDLFTCSNWDRMTRLGGRNSKYSAFSLCRMMDLGTVEFRMFNGTNDEETILEYLGFVHSMMQSAVSTASVIQEAATIAEVYELELDMDQAQLSAAESLLMIMRGGQRPSSPSRSRSLRMRKLNQRLRNAMY